MSNSYQSEIPKARVNIQLSLHTGGAQKKIELPLKLMVTRLSRLFMRAGQVSAWTLNQQRDLSRPGELFDEDAFFRLINVLLP